MKYLITPIEAAQPKRLDLRDTHTVETHWLFFPATGSAYRQYLKQKKHVEEQIKWLAVLTTDELYRVKQAIDNQQVPSFFKEIIDTIYSFKQQGKHVISISVGDNINKMPLFEYEDDSKWQNPTVPTNTETKTGPSEIFLPKRYKKPTLPMQQLPANVVKMLKNIKKG
jgi:hypothetical protein